MTPKTYARIDAGTVMELFTTAADIAELFHAELRWVEVADPAVAVGWTETADGFAPPAPPPAAVPAPAALAVEAATLAGLQAQLAALTAQLAALQASTPG